MFGFKSKKRKEKEARVMEMIRELEAKMENVCQSRDSIPTGDALSVIREAFKPLNLAEGDKVHWKSVLYRNSNLGKGSEQEFEVFSVLPAPQKVVDEHGAVDFYDFTVLVERGGTLFEIAMDSRRFSKIE